ncbi:flagellar protein FlgN [Salipiger abyssi]|uniref:flagellar protein FlgN n=1 Tax=Salipiger abyssi TaxID=1250539 RepID=UPI001A8E519D|nr:flagellar protein FlgN [Salipiger abyssi]MBN9886132.1 flagellar protein FlgN [Salipiger abyssi]
MTETDQTHETLFAALDSLLERERSALLDGALDEIGPLMEEKAALVARMAEAPPDEADSLQPLHLKLRRNQQLFDHALDGIRNVAKRLGALREIRESMEVYDAQGRRASIGGEEKSSMERRA